MTEPGPQKAYALYSPATLGQLRNVIEFARDAWPDDGAEGETVHLLCRELERRLDQERPPVECTGVAANWCPVHGDCTCPHYGDDPDNGRTLDDQDCPLHSAESDHGEAERAREHAASTPTSDYADQPWSVRGVLSKLAEAAAILLDQHDYDGHGHEEIRAAEQAARQMVDAGPDPVCFDGDLYAATAPPDGLVDFIASPLEYAWAEEKYTVRTEAWVVLDDDLCDALPGYLTWLQSVRPEAKVREDERKRCIEDLDNQATEILDASANIAGFGFDVTYAEGVAAGLKQAVKRLEERKCKA